MFSRENGVGGICHALLPERPSAAPAEERLRYVDSSIVHMLREFQTMGIGFDEMEIKVFGGADVLPVTNRRTVGRANIEAALYTLHDREIEVNVSDIGGRVGRKIVFSTHEGYVLVKKLKELYGVYEQDESPHH
jgi:chemotaxis protein CheD